MQTTVIEGSSIWTGLMPYLLPVLGTIITALVGWVLAILSKKLGIDIDSSQRDALQTALTNGAGLLVQRAGSSAAAMVHLDVKNPAVAAAVNYVLASAPDAVSKWGLTPEIIAKKLEAKLGLLTGATDTAGAVPSIPIVPSPGGAR